MAFSRFEKRFSGDSEPSHVRLMADPVPGRVEIDAELGARRLRVTVVVYVLAVGLQQVVIDVLRALFGPHSIDPQGFKFEHGRGAGGVLKQRAIDPDADFLALNRAALYHVRFYDFLRDVLSDRFLQ
nr:hypothetical protein [Desulfoglaeba alkanexedens]